MSISNKCKSCGGSLEYNPAGADLICRKCGNSASFDKSLDFHHHSIDMVAETIEPEFSFETKSSHCSNCGAIYGESSTNISGKCEYCGAHLVRDFSLSKASRPDACIPYMFDKTMARKKFAEGLKKKKFIPNKLKKQLPANDIESVYIPAYLFNAKTHNEYNGRIYDTYSRSDGSSERSYRRISGVRDVETRNIVIECSGRMSQLTLDKIRPFDLNQMYAFKDEFLLGYSVEYYDKKLQDAKKLVDEVVKYDVKHHILNSYSYDGIDYFNLKTKYIDANYSRVILPTYCVTYKYGKKEYKTFMNGQTGKVGGNVPRSKWKIAFTTIAILLGVGAFLYLLFS